jgi:uncharacterized membrane protein YphA (DoxX/SURF4 family)
MLRIAIALSLLLTLRRIADNGGPSLNLYFKHGIWMLYPGRPSAEVLAVVTTIAWGSTIAMLLGAFSRAAAAVSAITTMAVAAYTVSDAANWSHTDVPPVLASLAFLGARGGDALSLDAWYRAWRGRPRKVGGAYQASVRLVQLTVAAVFVLAAFEKIRAGGPTLAWALSDNLRNQLTTWFDSFGTPKTPVASWLVVAAWRYKLAACLNLASQLSPALAVIFVRRPWIRAIAGGLWCLEVIGLGVVMGLWNLPWLPLAAALVDWDALAAWFGAHPRDDTPARSPSRGQLAFVTGFVVFFAIQALWLNQRLQAFPFSGFPLFASVRAKRPYGTHQSYEYAAGHVQAIGADGSPAGGAAVDTWIARRSIYHALWTERSRAVLSRKLAPVLDDVRAAWPREAITGLRLWLTIFQAPAYPAPARLDRIDLAVVAEVDRGRFRSALGALLPDGRTWIAPPDAPELAGMQLFELRGDLPQPSPIAAMATRSGFVLATPLPGDASYLIGRAPGALRSWVLAYRRVRPSARAR